ncbi:MAG: hypothetical protein HY330_00870, partial [Chloroflexi bacterium]|nr:hypothetical protein [Chloroflexota bacterium]
ARCRLQEVTPADGPPAGRGDNGQVTWTSIGAHSTVRLLETPADLEKQRAKLDKELTAAQAHVERLQGKLANPEFTAKAPVQVVARERQALAEAQDRLARLQEQRQRLG